MNISQMSYLVPYSKKGYTAIINLVKDNRFLVIHKVGNEYRKKYVRCPDINKLQIDDVIYNIVQGYHTDRVENLAWYDDCIERLAFTNSVIYMLPNHNPGKEELMKVNLEFVQKDSIKSVSSTLLRKVSKWLTW